MTLSAFLKSHGYECRLLLNRSTDADLEALLTNCVAAGFSVYTGTGLTRSLAMSARIRRLKGDVPIVWGGYHPTLEADQTIRTSLVDYVVRGEGEQTFLELIAGAKMDENYNCAADDNKKWQTIIDELQKGDLGLQFVG